MVLKKGGLKKFIEQGEGYFVEFKEQIGVGIDKEMVAFANASGGKIVIGIANNGKIIGCTSDNIVRSKVQDIVIHGFRYISKQCGTKPEISNLICNYAEASIIMMILKTQNGAIFQTIIFLCNAK